AGAALRNAIGQMLELAHTSRSNNRYRYCIGDGPGKSQVEAGFGAVAIHAGKQDFAGAVVCHFASPFNGINASSLAPAVGEDFPAWGFTGLRGAARVDSHNDALRAVIIGSSLDQF